MRLVFAPGTIGAIAWLATHAEIAIAATREGDAIQPHPVFCLMGAALVESLIRFTQGGGRKIDAWTAQHRTVLVPFDRSEDDPLAFMNANTLDELRALEATSSSAAR